ncbi:FAD-binding protein [Desulfitobacterium chlororespirans]|uniref:Urocanate reductase n=1 Tax=Desulfitobacterium chlororespirans DSM 11544 TaxID=1121395 RepID=A0A1M7SN97_9FIRM|nr:FAD-binding protein [Desulfitobacterium chlororespirans]SHN59941.1 Succinate dehydrogenase/fumarate reductase, flavoprotein subunit [Desulfitobacterium chlororespirans DSM 11544]
MKNHMSRRNFLKGAATGALGMATVGLVGCGTSAVSGSAAGTASLPFEKTISWNAEYDVIVLGLGLAGGAAAMAAADQGAKVLIMEKASKGEDGGNSKYAGQGVLYVKPENRDGAIKYFQTIRGMYNTPGDDILEAFTDMIITNQDWMIKHGANALHFADAIGEFTDIPGYDLMDCWSIDATIHDGKLFNFVRNYGLKSDSIDVWFEVPAQAFIQDPETGIVHGVRTSVNGQEYNIRALNGIVLCTGGFENNIQMIQDYHQLPYAYAKGGLYNTGDGIKMAMDIGADLWHMSNIAGPDLNAIDPTTKRALGYAMMGYHPLLSTAFTCGTASIIVGADGTRFVDEGTIPGHGFIHFHGMKLRMPVSLPAYCVFDSTAINKTIYKVWDNQDKVKDGTIITADTLDELAAKLGLPEGSLSSTVTQYNEFCAKGQDVVFHKKAEYLVPFSGKGPYYGFEVYPTYTNTQGGPRRSAKGEIMNVAGKPIPHLYSAGECGSIWGDIYQGAGNLAECISFGRISGANAAAAKTDNLRESAITGTPVNFNTAAEADHTTAANEFIGTGNGIGGDVTVKMTVNDGKITSIDVLEHSETENIGGAALNKLVEQALTAQGPKIDGVSGATVTSDAFKAALTEAMTKAGI